MEDIKPYEEQKPSECVYFLAGLGGMVNNPNRRTTLGSIHITISIIMNTSFTLSCFLHLFGEDSPQRKVVGIQIFVTLINILVRHFNLLLRATFLAQFLIEMDRLWDEMLGKKIKLATVNRKIRIFTFLNMVIFLVPIPLSLVLWRHNIGLPYDQIKDRLPSFSPFPKSWPYATFVLQLFYSFYSLSNDSISITILFAISMYIGYFTKCLHEMLKAEGTDENFGKGVFELHQAIIRQLKDFNNLFSGPFFLAVLVNTFEVAGRVFLILSTGNGIVINVFFVVLTFYRSFIVSYCGTYVTAEMEKIFIQAYQNLWYTEGVKRQKELYLMLIVANKPATFRFKDLITFGMPQFAAFCQAVYSYISVMKLIFN